MKQIIVRYVAIGLVALSVAGCGTIRDIYYGATEAKVDAKTVVLAASAFDSVEILATNYLRSPRCTENNRPICRDPSVTPTIIGSVRAGRVARNNLKQFLRDHPGQLGPRGDYDAMITATNTLKDALATYRDAVTR